MIEFDFEYPAYDGAKRMSRPLSYRPDIDGLRAIAVMSVAMCHFHLFLHGGFVGVDVFFVISGYLIAGLIRKELISGTFSFSDFWIRRVRRIMPALVSMTIATLIAGWFFLLPKEYISLAHSTRAMILFYSNMYFISDTGYFKAAAEEKPLLHTWSLAVEEQYYLILPLLLVLLWRRMSERNLIVAISITTLVSFLVSVRGTDAFPTSTFYLMPTRAWELLFGTLLAFREPRLTTSRSVGRELGALAGLLMILIPVCVYKGGMEFPGLAALPPVAGAALLIWAGSGGSKLPLINRVLASKPTVFVGLISYSLYLWHWPILLFASQRSISPMSREERIGLLALSILAGIVSWRWIETPLRTKKILASSRSLLIVIGLAFVALFSITVCIDLKEGFVNRFSPAALRHAESANPDQQYRIEVNTEDIPANLTRYGNSNEPAKLIVWGDSHGMAALPAIEAQCLKTGVSTVVATRSGTIPAFSQVLKTRGEEAAKKLEFSKAVLNYVKKEKIGAVLLVAEWRDYLGSNENKEALLYTIDQLHEDGINIYFMKDVPSYPFNIPKAMVRYSMSGQPLEGLALPSDYLTKNSQAEAQMIPSLVAKGVKVLDPLPYLTSGQELTLPYDSEGSFYWDNSHLTTHGALKIEQMFSEMFTEISRR